jgi:hypothetical protein
MVEYGGTFSDATVSKVYEVFQICQYGPLFASNLIHAYLQRRYSAWKQSFLRLILKFERTCDSWKGSSSLETHRLAD